nr:hypothetical protein Iba_chr02dCG5740 [Ipomoea batatas]
MDVNEWGFFTLKEKVLKLGYDSSYDVKNDESQEDDECEWASDEDFVERLFFSGFQLWKPERLELLSGFRSETRDDRLWFPTGNQRVSPLPEMVVFNRKQEVVSDRKPEVVSDRKPERVSEKVFLMVSYGGGPLEDEEDP